MKKTKIIATIGPASKDEKTIEELMIAGMDIARINMTHADHEFCRDIVSKVNRINKKLNKNTAVMLDLKGPDIATHKFQNGSAFFKQGDKIRIYEEELLGDNTKFSVDYPNFVSEIKIGTIIKINDGLVEIEVINKNSDSLVCEVKKEGNVHNKSGINVIDTKLNLPFISKRDKEDIKLACELNVDFLALSFVSSYEDVINVNDLLIELDDDHIAIITKIENERAYDDLDEIINVSDGIMIARGDLGTEIPMERIPSIQKNIINKCHEKGKVSIVATEMMTTMEVTSRPTRAEVSDVANSVIDGVDVVMLSGETTVGKYPKETVEMMSRILEASEKDINYNEFLDKTTKIENKDITGSIAHSVVDLANTLKCDFIMTPTISGYTAKKISRFRPSSVIIALCPDAGVVKELNIYYGVYPVLIKELKSFDDMMKRSKEIAGQLLNEEQGRIIITGGYPFSEVKHTNFMKIEEL